ncbi:hypothetical protein [uncultured Aquimarina sp.]|uniref:hypothetical protein n=1 Tax=uncultured Aquimarina sp. TaxID=575652 RepID=UPI00262A0718|nr:hypothetical protein [uncultured Aquimarina sp.]
MKEELKSLQSELNKSYNRLLKIESNKITIEPEFTFESNIELKDKGRSCKIYPFFFSEIPKYVFEWDDCPIFEISSTDIKRQGKIIINWVLEKSMPSKIQTQFPEIELNELAKYYENGEGIKGEFIESWNILEKGYNQWLSIEPCEQDKDAIRLIKEMRNFKLDELLRVGTQLSVFILSRSRRHGIDENSPQIRIGFLGNNKMKIYSNLKNRNKSLECEVKYEGYFEGIVKELLKEKIK